jgi:2',3'-cyclic-nucleotide 2'-phosphodiesterase (5'-nucleotidase family)
MGNLVADAMRTKYPGVDAALTNSGGLRADILISPPSTGEQPGEITWGEVFAVLPFGNRTVIETLTGAQLTEALLNGFSPVCNTAIATGRFPQVSGLKLDFHCNGTTPVVDGIALAPNGPGGPLTPVGPADTVRIVTNDFMLTGGDGYTALAGGTDVLQPGDGLLEVTIEYITANSPVAPAVEGRIVRADPEPRLAPAQSSARAAATTSATPGSASFSSEGANGIGRSGIVTRRTASGPPTSTASATTSAA